MVRSGRTGYIIDTCGPRNRFSDFQFKHAPRVNMFDCSDRQQDMVIDNSRSDRYTVGTTCMLLFLFKHILFMTEHDKGLGRAKSYV